jgi:uncharacterized protein
MNKIAVAGGTGFVGQALVKQLRADGYHVVVISRDERSVYRCFSDQVVALTWKADDDEVQKKLLGCCAIINLAGENISAERWTDDFKATLTSSRMNAAKTLTHWVSLLKNKPRVFVGSAVSAYGIYPQIRNVHTEKSKLQQNSFLSALTISQESSYANLSRAGVSVHFLRFGLVMAPSGGVLKQLLLPTKLCLGAVMGSGNQPWSWIGLDDLIRSISFLLTQKNLQPSYNCVNQSGATQKEVVDMLAYALKRPRIFRVPGFILKIMLGKQMALELLLSGTSATPDNLIAAGFVFQQPTLDGVIQKHDY